ncbi:AraC family transcriptional regulator [Sphingobacterium sp. SGG-5]|uniref:AraC family transcriptional regulator n=1 Tax=Sphingobacterium sp. SGG-5 TaxID=2710881 RepID=UPI0013EA0EEB|nr:AraC family transcriptional regulator [Sphingobacterium sp. SGG-5]NGM61092.1 AraC family transcriptional regulator [Sphingobacterium sp. SGG-5]
MLKASFEIITRAGKESFTIREFDRKGFSAPFHYHPEYELTFITQGKGERFVGSDMSAFEENDLVLLGADLPHCWKLDTPKDTTAGSFVIQFSPDFLGGHFFDTPELSRISDLLKKSNSGIEFSGRIKNQVRESMQQMLLEKDNFERLLLFLKILHSLSLSDQYRLLNKNTDSEAYSHDNRERILKVFAYIVEHFRSDISVANAAATIGMTTNAFCRYFKKMTRKTFIETVIDYRISYATQLLVQTDYNITNICYECGFRDISHFYKMFTARMQMSPLNYRKRFLNTINLS